MSITPNVPIHEYYTQNTEDTFLSNTL